ncbi:MAG: hypothetical protein ABF868_11790, partial [Sporolactobacillus sp.]
MNKISTFQKLKCWMFWKSKIRWKQIWGNYQLFNLPNPYIASVLSIIPRLIGILVTFSLGFVVAYGYKRYLNLPSVYLWTSIFILFLTDGISDGLKTGKWISNTTEEDWLLTSCSLGNIEYLLFLWIDESIWNLNNRLLSTLALFFGALIAMPEQINNFLVSIIMLFILNGLITLLFTTFQYYVIRKSIYIQGRGFLFGGSLLVIGLPLLIYFTNYLSFILNNYFGQASHFDGLLRTFEFSIINLYNIFNNRLFPFSSLALILTNGPQLAWIISLLGFIAILLLINLFIFHLINNHDHIVTRRSTYVDKFLLSIFNGIVSILPLKSKKEHLKLYLLTIFNNY